MDEKERNIKKTMIEKGRKETKERQKNNWNICKKKKES